MVIAAIRKKDEDCNGIYIGGTMEAPMGFNVLVWRPGTRVCIEEPGSVL